MEHLIGKKNYLVMNRSGFALNIAWTDNFQPNAKITRCVCNITMTPKMIYMFVHREVILMNAFGTYIKVHFKLHNSRSNDMQFAFSNYGSIKNKKVFQRNRI